MTLFQTGSLLLTLAAFGAYINHRFLKLPATIGLMLVSLLIALSTIGLNSTGLVDLSELRDFIAHIDFSSFVLHGVLSFLLFAGALHIDLSELKKHRAIIISLATIGVILATFITGTLVWYIAHLAGFPLPYAYALLFGALISPTDPVAVLGMLKEGGLSKNLRIKIGCESLLNDGVAVVAFLVVLGLVTDTGNHGPFSIGVLLAWECLGSVILGLTLGWITSRLLAPIDEYKVEVMLTLALVTGGYCLAEAIHVSAPITMVIAGLVIGNHGRHFSMSEQSRLQLDNFWELIDEILNAVLFVIVGLLMMVITITPVHITLGLTAIIATLVGRYISVSVPVYMIRLRYRFETGTIRLLTWGGLRGGISIAMALSLPPGTERDLILSMTYITVIFSVLFQGTTFRYLAEYIAKK